MYAVIQTGGKQYRVRTGDLLVVDKLDGAAGDEIAFEAVLLIGEGAAVTLGAPLVVGASVNATLVETRKGKKIKVFKKIRRQGYRRTRGHRQWHSVVRVTAMAGGGTSEKWDGAVDLTPLATLNARARNLARGQAEAAPEPVASAPEPKAAKVKAKPTAAKKPAAKTAAAKKPAAKAAPAAKAKPVAAKKPAAKTAAAEKPAAKAAPAAKATSAKAKPAKSAAKPAAKPIAKTAAKPTAKKAAKPASVTSTPAKSAAAKKPAKKKP